MGGNTNPSTSTSTAAASSTQAVSSFAPQTTAPGQPATPASATKINPTAIKTLPLTNKPDGAQPALSAAPSKSSKAADDLSSMLDDLTNSLSSTDSLQDVK